MYENFYFFLLNLPNPNVFLGHQEIKYQAENLIFKITNLILQTKT